jgi:hypothetical protein
MYASQRAPGSRWGFGSGSTPTSLNMIIAGAPLDNAEEDIVSKCKPQAPQGNASTACTSSGELLNS